jgi:hypothetical protein
MTSLNGHNKLNIQNIPKTANQSVEKRKIVDTEVPDKESVGVCKINKGHRAAQDNTRKNSEKNTKDDRQVH